MSVPETPYTRGEMYLSAIADGDSGGIPERPYTRKEMYLDAIARGDSSGIPERPYTREEMYLDAIAKNGGGGGGGDITVESKSINANGTYTAPTGKAYSPVTVSVPASAVDSGTKSITSNGNNQDVVGYAAVDVAVPNSYAAGDEGKVVSNGQLVAQTAHAEVTSNGTIDTTLNDSVVVNVSGSSGYGYTKLAEADFAVNTSSTTAIDVGTINCGASAWTKNKVLYVRVRDKAGARDNYFCGSDSYLINAFAGTSYVTATAFSKIIMKKISGTSYNTGSSSLGIYPTEITDSGLLTIKAKYSSANSGTIDGTYHVEVYLLDWPDGVSPFN